MTSNKKIIGLMVLACTALIIAAIMLFNNQTSNDPFQNMLIKLKKHNIRHHLDLDFLCIQSKVADLNCRGLITSEDQKIVSSLGLLDALKVEQMSSNDEFIQYVNTFGVSQPLKDCVIQAINDCPSD